MLNKSKQANKGLRLPTDDTKEAAAEKSAHGTCVKHQMYDTVFFGGKLVWHMLKDIIEKLANYLRPHPFRTFTHSQLPVQQVCNTSTLMHTLQPL